MTTQATTPPAAGATLHLGGDAYCSPDLEPLLVPATDLTLYPGNARRHDQDAITASIRDLGCWRAAVAQRSTGHVLIGNGQHRSLLDLGAERVPVTYRDCSDALARVIVVRDNLVGDLATNDPTDLLALLAAAEADDLYALTGYPDDEMDALRAQLAASDYTPPVATPSLADRFVVPPFSVLDQRGGAWQDRKRQWLALGIQSEVGRGSTAEGQVSEKWNRDRKTNLDGEDAARYGRTDTRRPTASHMGVGPSGESLRNNPDQYRQIAGRSMKGQEGLTAIKPNLAGALAGQRSLGQGLQGHRDPTTGELVYTETTAAGVSIFDPVLTELAYRWFSPPGGHVLDPFAGGSVRGIVAAALGRTYTGVELRAEQVAANEGQADTIVPRLPRVAGRAQGDHRPELTPVETHAGVLVKRDDAWRVGGAAGAKSRTMHRLLVSGQYAGLMTGGASVSPQIERAALVAEATGHPCRVHTGTGPDTPEVATATTAGAEVLRHRPARLTVIKARLREDSEDSPDWLCVPFGMGMEEYVADVAAQVTNLPPDARVVVPVGSGATLAGILRGLDAAGDPRPVLGITVGGAPGHLDTFAPGWQDRPGLTLQASTLDYADHAPNTLGDLTLDPQYEAKCLPYVTTGDVLWLVACRTSAERHTTGSAPAPRPRWHTGDSNVVLPGLTVTADLIFSCPPYADLEVYSEDPADLSNMPYDQFLTVYRQIIAKACAHLRDDRYAVWVIGEVRDKRGHYRGLVPDTIRAFTDAGLSFYNEAILVTPVGSLPIRAGRQFSAGRKLGKTHQNVLVFCKGDPRAAADACGTVEVTMPEVSEEA